MDSGAVRVMGAAGGSFESVLSMFEPCQDPDRESTYGWFLKLGSLLGSFLYKGAVL